MVWNAAKGQGWWAETHLLIFSEYIYAFDYIHRCMHTDTHIFYLFRRCLCASALALCTSNHTFLSGMHSFYHSLALQLSSTLPSLWVIWHLPPHYYTLALTDSPGAPLTQEESTRGQGPLFNCIEDLSCISRNICWKISKLSRGLFRSCLTPDMAPEAVSLYWQHLLSGPSCLLSSPLRFPPLAQIQHASNSARHRCLL